MSHVPWFIDLCGILGTVPLFSPVAFVADTLSNQFFIERMVLSTTVSPARGAPVTMTQLDMASEFLQSMLEKWGKEEYHLRPPHPNDIANILWDPLLWMRRLGNTEIQNFFTQDQLIIVFSFGVVHLSIFHTSSLMTCGISDPGDLQERLQDMSTQREELLHQTAKSMARELQLGIPRWHGDFTGWRTSNMLLIRNFQWKWKTVWCSIFSPDVYIKVTNKVSKKKSENTALTVTFPIFFL